MGPDFGGHHHPGGHGGFHHEHWSPLLPGLLMTVLLVVLLAVALASALWFSGPMTAALLERARARSVPDPWRARWDDAVERYRATAEAFAAFECDIAAVLRMPGLADVTQPATARFVEAFAEAGALFTDEFPEAPYAERFVRAAELAQRAWTTAVESAGRIRDARLAPRERALVEKVRTLLDVVGSSPFAAERRTAYQQARRRLAELERCTGWRLPQPAALALEQRARGVITPIAG
jgi:hypothetical protein